MKEKIILIGGGGHCRSCIGVIQMTNQYDILGVIDRDLPIGSDVLGYKVLGRDDVIETWVSKNVSFLITIGHIKSVAPRKTAYKKIENMGGRFATVVSPAATVSRDVDIADGSIVMHGAVINSGAAIGSNCIINSQCLIEHDVVIGDHTHISTGCIVNGDCTVGNETFVGSGSILKNGIKIGNNCLVSFGTRVGKDVLDGKFVS